MGRGTTVKHIYPDELKRLLLAVPPLPEQAAIATFLVSLDVSIVVAVDRVTDKYFNHYRRRHAAE